MTAKVAGKPIFFAECQECQSTVEYLWDDLHHVLSDGTMSHRLKCPVCETIVIHQKKVY